MNNIEYSPGSKKGSSPVGVLVNKSWYEFMYVSALPVWLPIIFDFLRFKNKFYLKKITFDGLICLTRLKKTNFNKIQFKKLNIPSTSTYAVQSYANFLYFNSFG